MFILTNMWFQTLMRTFFFSIDKLIFNFISIIYDFLIAISRTSVLSQPDILDMASRVNKLLAIFMVFKVTFSLIMYVVNPDDFTDNNKGVGKLTTNIIISLGLLILTPYIFNLGYQLQSIILKDNSLAALIFGSEKGDSNQSSFNTAGDKMAYSTMVPFFVPNMEIEALYPCATLTVIENDKTVMNKECASALEELSDEDKSSKFKKQTYLNYKAGVDTGSLGILFRLDAAVATIKDGENENYVIEYRYLFSTVIGIVVILLLLTFCMDVAIRSVKLAFLQLIAPIPILSYVDPKSGKDGMFKKWYEMCFKTYLSLFIRLLALYFAVYIISRIDRMVDITTGAYITEYLLRIMIIIGALMFAKQLPKILEGLGLKLDGGFTFNPLKKIENELPGGKRIAGFAKAAPAAGLAGAAAFGTNLIAKNGNVLSAAAGAASATGRGLIGAAKGEKFGKNFSNSYGGAMKARTNRDDRRELGVNAFDVAGENIRSVLHIPNTQQKNKALLEHLNDYTTAGNAAKTRAEGEIDKKLSQISVNGENLGALKNYVDVLKNTDPTGLSDAARMDLAENISKAEAKYFNARKQAVNAYVANSSNLSQSKFEWTDSKGNNQRVEGFNSAFTGAASSDPVVSSNVGKMKQLNSDFSMGQKVNDYDIGSSIQGAANETARIQGSREYRKAELIAQQAQKEKK